MVHFPSFLHLVGQTPLFISFFQSQTNCMETLVVTWMVQDMFRLLWNPKVYKSSLTLRRLMSYIYIYIYIYIYGAPILDVSRSHTTTQHSR